MNEQCVIFGIFLATSSLIINFFSHKKILAVIGLLIYFFYLIYLNILPIYLICLTSIFYGMVKLSYNNYYNKNYIFDIIFIIISLIFYFCLQSHIFPGVHNILVAKNILIGKKGIAWDLYVNHDKALVSFIALFETYDQLKSKSMNFMNYKYSMIVMLLGIVFIIVLSLITGFIKYDFKIDAVIWLWGINNLFMVCVVEEIFFRLFLYKKLLKLNIFKKYNHWIALVLSSLLFGMFHYTKGSIYMMLAFFAGIMYCLLYIYSGKI